MDGAKAAAISRAFREHTLDDSYVDLIKTVIAIHGDVPAYKTKLARVAVCQKSYFSRVLAGISRLSLEQSSALCDFWQLSFEESMYFLQLVIRDRSATDSLRDKMNHGLISLKPLLASSPDLLHK